MGLLEEVDEFAKQAPGRLRCGVARLLEGEELDDQDKTELVVVMDRPVAEVGHWVIEKIMERRGIRLTQSTIGWHRNGRCSCNSLGAN